MALGKDMHLRRAAYRALFNQAPDEKQNEHIRYSSHKGLPLGGESFKAQIETQLQIKLGTGKVGRPPKSD